MPTQSTPLLPDSCPRLSGYCAGWRAVVLLWVAMAMAVPALAEGNRATPASLEYQVKAGFLFNFARYVDWPTSTNAAAEEFVIGIIDDGTVFPVMAAALNGKSTHDRTVEIRRLKLNDDIARCQMLFVTRSEEKDLDAILKRVGGAPVLTVGEAPHFAERGGCLNFVPHGENIRFEVNLEAAERAGLKISAKIAAMATIVRRPGGAQ
jgi:hypothetical protein